MTDANKSSEGKNWPKDEFGRSEVFSQLGWWAIPVIGLLTVISWPLWNNIRAKKKERVVVYCAQDQLYAQPVFTDFEKATGFKVLTVYDNEVVKTVGLANRLLAERSHPRCDVFWGNEEMRTRQLAAANVFRPTNGWAAFGYRSRRIVFNTNHLTPQTAPHSLLELTNQTWRGKVALAYPQFGTTAAHFHALRQLWGDSAWQLWCRALANNKPFLLDGNSMVVKLVGKGEAWIGITDSDDIADAQREGMPVAPCPMNNQTLLIPNTVALIRNAPHSQAGESLFKYLQTADVVKRLIDAKALEGRSIDEVSIPTLKVDWETLLRGLQSVTDKLNEIFLR